jgi:hypothetical protein
LLVRVGFGGNLGGPSLFQRNFWLTYPLDFYQNQANTLKIMIGAMTTYVTHSL